MADALCGPSNPLQQFKQQTQFDRSLQQDRLASRHAPTQGFRSVDPNAGLLDPEFEAFQAGVPPSELAHHLPVLQGPSRQSPGPSWANDFQQLHISPPSTFQPQQQHAPQFASASGGNWAEGFREQIANTAPRVQNAAPTPQAFQYMARFGMNGYQSQFAQPSYAQPMQSKGKQPVTAQFDDAAFEQAFNQASEALAAEQQTVEDVDMMQQEPYVHGASTGDVDRLETYADAMMQRDDPTLHDPDFLAALDRLENDPIAERMLRGDIPAEQEQMQDSPQTNDEDALAQTAQELLEKVEHNQSDKFQKSQFLGLMRRLRDREVKVEGDKMVETAAAATTTRFDNSEQTPQLLHQQQPPVDVAPLDYTIPPHGQDHDAWRNINAQDGQAVVDLLNEPDSEAPSHDIGTSEAPSPPFGSFPAGVFYADLRQRGWSEREMGGRQLQERGDDESNVDWKRWDLQSPSRVGGSHRGPHLQQQQPPPGMH